MNIMKFTVCSSKGNLLNYAHAEARALDILDLLHEVTSINLKVSRITKGTLVLISENPERALDCRAHEC